MASRRKAGPDFWDAAKFPGARMLADMASGSPNLEFALIADGVPMDKIFPIDIDRAFKSLSRIKPYIKKFWDTGAVAANAGRQGCRARLLPATGASCPAATSPTAR